MLALKRLWKNNYFKTAVAIILIIAVVLSLFFGLQIWLHTSDPALTVISPSMYIVGNGPSYEPGPDGNYVTLNNIWLSLTHPFSRTLGVGDIVIVEGVNPKDLNGNYPNSDIIIYRDPSDPSTLIVHRIVVKQNINGTWYFQTKGDGNGQPLRGNVSSYQYDGHTVWNSAQYSDTGIPQNLVVGKVVMRIPWFGWITMIMRDNSWGLPIIIAIILAIVIVEFVIPILRQKKPSEQKPNPNPPQMQSTLD